MPHATIPPLQTVPPNRTVTGIVSMLIGISFLSTMGVLAKLATETVSLAEVVFFRNAFGMLAPFLIIASRGRWELLMTRRLPGHITRATIGVTAMVLTFWALHLLPLPDATALSFTSPLFLTALSWPVLGEKVGPHRWGAVIVGFLGVLILARPSGDIINAGFLVAISAAFATAMAGLMLRQLGRTESAATTAFYFALFATLYSLLPLPFFWSTPSWKELALLIGMGSIGGLGQHFMTRAYAMAPAAVVGPFTYISIVWACLFGWLIWNDTPDVYVLTGTSIVIASGLYILYRETRKRHSV